MTIVEEALKKTGFYSLQEFAHFEREAVFKEFDRNEHISKPGQVCRSAYYVLSGAAYQHKLMIDGGRAIVDLGTHGKWMLDQQSFVAQQPANTYITAYERTQVLQLSIDAIHRLITVSPSFFQLGQLFGSASQQPFIVDRSLTPLEKYRSLLGSSPLLLQKFPLKMIASYLNITPETLSRVRKKILLPENIS